MSNPFDAEQLSDMMKNSDFMRKAREAEQRLTETMVIGHSEMDQVRIRMNCKFERFEIRIAPQALQSSPSNLQQQVTQAYEDAFQQIQRRLKAHILSLTEAMPPLTELPNFDALPELEATESSR